MKKALHLSQGILCFIKLIRLPPFVMADKTTVTWKAFENNRLTHSAAHYLMAIDDLIEQRGYARLTDVAKKLDITPGSCSITLKKLKNKGLVEEDENKFLRLSKEGGNLVQIVKKNAELLMSLLVDIVGVSKKQAEVDACKMEHLLSMETSFKLACFLKFMQKDSSEVRAFKESLQKQEPVCWKDFEIDED